MSEYVKKEDWKNTDFNPEEERTQNTAWIWDLNSNTRFTSLIQNSEIWILNSGNKGGIGTGII